MKVEEYKKLLAKKKPNKFGAKRTKDYDSTGEGKRYQELVLLEKAGKIFNLKRQQSFPLWLGDIDPFTVCHYKADFTYYEQRGTQVVEDFKGKPEPLFFLKAKMFWWLYCDGPADSTSLHHFRISRKNGVIIDITDIKQLTEKGIAPEITAWRKRKRDGKRR